MDKPSPSKKIKISPESDASETSTNTTVTAVEASVEQRSPSTTPSIKNDVKRVAFMETNKEQPVPSKKEPRLAMKKMVLNDFKSYAGRQVIGPFHKSFSAIVGPNGSGKSNVIDALLFVFGYRANKMRQGKLSELIHNSAKYPNCQTCSVEIHFHEIIDGDDPNDYTVVPNSELVIARQASRNNSSKYFINNKSSNFTEVTTLLKTRGIDLDHKRFLILQEIEILTERMNSGKKAVEESEEQIEKFQKMVKDKQRELKTLPDKIKELKTTLEEMESYLSELTTSEAEKRAQLSNARQKAEDARLSLQHSQNRGKVLSSILRLRDSGRVDGIYDRLGSLGVIDDKYDVAISTACPALDNIVVETVEAAQACIQYLRKNNLGRAVFTILNQLRPPRKDKMKTPEHAPRLFDLIEPKDEKFIPAFYSVLQDTLVAQDLKQANRIAYGEKRWRVVTLDGKLIEMSGAMSGGGNKQLKGAMSSTFREDGVSAETVADLEKERDELEKKCKDISEEKRATELALKRKKEQLPRLEMSGEKLQMDLRSLEAQLEEEKSRMIELKKQIEPSPADLERQEEIENQIEELVAEIDQLKEKTKVIEQTIASLHEQIMNAGGNELRQQKTCVNNIRKKIDSLNTQITKNMVAKSKAEKDVIRLEASIRKIEKEAEQFETKLKELEEEAGELSQQMHSIAEDVNRTKKLMEEKKTEIEDVRAQLDEKIESINKLRQSEVDIKNKLEDYKRTLVDNQKKAAHWEEQRSKLFLQRITGDETDEQLQLQIFEGEDLQELAKSKQSIKMEIAEIEAFVQSAKPNLSVLEEYRRRLAEYDERKKDLDTITSERDTVKNEVDTLRKARLDEFMQGFNIISQKLKEMYQMITMGGNAELELVDSLDPFSEGIVFSVMPPKKSWKNISNLSGGEKVNKIYTIAKGQRYQ
ncbi:Putative Structural maintenance of chromosomes protein [Rhizopus microsporus]|nr:Putative Structural maintenance of chromosomes protein [Rhizopus microsporus]